MSCETSGESGFDMRAYENVEAFIQGFGDEPLEGQWIKIDQAMINGFADVTGDHQWIHTDPEAAKDGPFGSTIAHGYLTVALIPRLMRDVYEIKQKAMGLNYGIERLRFPSPVLVDSLVRAKVALADSQTLESGDRRILFNIEVQVKGQVKPACVADLIFLYS